MRRPLLLGDVVNALAEVVAARGGFDAVSAVASRAAGIYLGQVMHLSVICTCLLSFVSFCYLHHGVCSITLNSYYQNNWLRFNCGTVLPLPAKFFRQW